MAADRLRIYQRLHQRPPLLLRPHQRPDVVRAPIRRNPLKLMFQKKKRNEKSRAADARKSFTVIFSKLRLTNVLSIVSGPPYLNRNHLFLFHCRIVSQIDFSCALVSDILLQGHLYITDNYFAFYSNVFGFVTKLLIPTVSVVKISKEKTAKIIPNAVGVATADERHVFGSFMSREAAYQLMLSVWRPVAPVEPAAEIVPKLPAADVEISEYSIEEDSSSAISGNESPPRGGVVMDSTTSTDASNTVRHRISAAVLHDKSYDAVDGSLGAMTSNSALPSRSTSPAPRIVSVSRFYHIQFPDRYINIGICLSILLAILSAFLFYRIINFQSRTNNLSSSPIDSKWVSWHTQCTKLIK